MDQRTSVGLTTCGAALATGITGMADVEDKYAVDLRAVHNLCESPRFNQATPYSWQLSRRVKWQAVMRDVRRQLFHSCRLCQQQRQQGTGQASVSSMPTLQLEKFRHGGNHLILRAAPRRLCPAPPTITSAPGGARQGSFHCQNPSSKISRIHCKPRHCWTVIQAHHTSRSVPNQTSVLHLPGHAEQKIIYRVKGAHAQGHKGRKDAPSQTTHSYGEAVLQYKHQTCGAAAAFNKFWSNVCSALLRAASAPIGLGIPRSQACSGNVAAGCDVSECYHPVPLTAEAATVVAHAIDHHFFGGSFHPTVNAAWGNSDAALVQSAERPPWERLGEQPFDANISNYAHGRGRGAGGSGVCEQQGRGRADGGRTGGPLRELRYVVVDCFSEDEYLECGEAADGERQRDAGPAQSSKMRRLGNTGADLQFNAFYDSCCCCCDPDHRRSSTKWSRRSACHWLPVADSAASQEPGNVRATSGRASAHYNPNSHAIVLNRSVWESGPTPGPGTLASPITPWGPGGRFTALQASTAPTQAILPAISNRLEGDPGSRQAVSVSDTVQCEWPNMQDAVRSDGVVCTSRLEWLAHTLGHEMLHAAMFTLCGRGVQTLPRVMEQAGHGPAFQALNRYFYGHTSFTFTRGWRSPLKM